MLYRNLINEMTVEVVGVVCDLVAFHMICGRGYSSGFQFNEQNICEVKCIFMLLLGAYSIYFNNYADQFV